MKKLWPYTEKKKTKSAPPKPSQEINVLILQIESTIINMYKTTINKHKQQDPTFLKSWDPSRFLSDSNGIRLLEEIARRTQTICTEEQIKNIAFTLPGTLDEPSTIEGSSRLGIYEAVNVTVECSRLGMPPVEVFHDAECQAIGEVIIDSSRLSTTMERGKETFVYIVVDEGVGSSVFINGRPYYGAGVAGHIGRLVMNPCGTFNPTFNSRGTLEVYAARPWISQNVVNEYLAEKDKSGALPDNSSPFRAAVAVAADSGKAKLLSFPQLADGAREKDTLLLPVLLDAAQSLGFAMNAIITILNPPLIVLGGGMITEIPGFSQQVIDYARRNSFAGIWNETIVDIAHSSKDSQVKGAAYLLSQSIYGDS